MDNRFAGKGSMGGGKVAAKDKVVTKNVTGQTNMGQNVPGVQKFDSLASLGEESGLRFLNDGARAHWLATEGVHEPLVLVFAEPWPEGALLTRNGAAIASRALKGTGAQFVPIDAAEAVLSGFLHVLDSEDVKSVILQLKGRNEKI